MAATETPKVNTYTEADYTDFDHTGPGTLAGRYLRLFWHPIYRAEDLPPAWAKPVKIMSEEMTLYRGETGQVHLIAMRCAHRGTQLSTGWVEDDCVRCRYHGWKFDGNGQCVEAPLEEPNFHQRIKIRSYPVEEYLGLIFAYMGEGDPPPFQHYPVMEQEGIYDVETYTRACNVFNELENDPGHGPFTHKRPDSPRGVYNYPEEIKAAESDFGVTNYSRFPNGDIRSNNEGMPNIRHTITSSNHLYPGSNLWCEVMRWKLPIDDYNHVSFQTTLIPLTGDQAQAYYDYRKQYLNSGGKIYDPHLSEEILAGKYRLEDVEREQRKSIDILHIQDDATQIGQGAIRDRSQEHLGRSDAYVVVWRRIWEREMRALAEGRPLKQWRLPEDLMNHIPANEL
jgi:5,5'-dehydrodivanillate O-demethylase oxygenase subunit